MPVNNFNPKNRKYHKTNFVDLLEFITPDIYSEEDLNLSGEGLNPLSELINCHIKLAQNFSRIIPLSSIPGTQTENLNNIYGICQYFVKQNKLTNISPYEFESKILIPLGTSLANFNTSAEFISYLSGTLLPKIVPPNNIENRIQSNISTLSSLTNDVNASSVHNYLVDALGWFYFLNIGGRAFNLGGRPLEYSPSSYVLQSLNTLYRGNKLETVDGIKGLTEHLWRNNHLGSFKDYIPQAYISGTADSIINTSSLLPVATYTSGTQKLEALNTLVDIVYSPLYLDQKDFSVKNAFDEFLDSGMYLDDFVSKGPHRKFLNTLAYHFADINDEVENIELIYDIDNVRDEHIQYIADLIGFKLRGSSAAKWRQQLLTAINLYKASGTLWAIRAAIKLLIVDSVFDLSGKVQELWESYLPHVIWYSLGTESPLFKDLNTWTYSVANRANVYQYNTSSLEENLKIVTDSIILDLYKAFPNNFISNGKIFDPPRLMMLDNKTGEEVGIYTLIGEPNMKPFHIMESSGAGFQAYRFNAKLAGDLKAFKEATAYGVLGSGVYLAGEEELRRGDTAIYLKPVGDINFLFNYRGKTNYPLPPFEEIKYYKDCSITAPMVDFLVERLKCFKVNNDFSEQVGEFLLSSVVSADNDLGALSDWLMFFSSIQTPPNFDEFILNISNFDTNLLSLWCGKSSHLFVNFEDTDFDFSKTTLEGDGKYALYEAARVVKEFSPGHAVPKVNLTGNSVDDFTMSATKYDYIGIDRDTYFTSYTSASVISNFEYSGAAMSFATGGGDTTGLGSDSGRGGLSTFKRASADNILDNLLSSVTTITPVQNVARRATRRRNLKYLLPHEGYYDRTGFNGPITYDPSVYESSFPSSLGELTLGYVASAGKFHPVVDPINPSGVWHACEKYDSPRAFSGIYTSSTFPYRGVHSLGSNAKVPEEGPRPSRYVDRGQVPQIYITMNKALYEKAKARSNSIIKEATTTAYSKDNYWKNNILSLANQSIVDGFTINSFSDYENFSFGRGLHELHREYCKYFVKHSLNPKEMDNTGGNIFAHVYGQGLYNCNFEIAGSAVSNLIATDVYTSSAIDINSIWKTGANGTTVVTTSSQAVIPLSGTFIEGNVYNAEFRNPHILSGIEFCDISGAPRLNSFSIFKLNSSGAVKGMDDYLIENTVIKCKSVGGLPRIRFDLSSYGDRRNYFIKDHRFNLKIKAVVANEHEPILGGARMGVWIHTQPVNGLIWSWTSEGWTPMRTSELSIPKVIQSSNIYNFEIKPPTGLACFGNFSIPTSEVNNLSIQNLKEEYFETYSLDFDTRNYTVQNNSEYLEIIPIQDPEYKITEQVHRDDTNYIVEVFLIPNSNVYLLIDSIQLQDLTLRDRAAIPLGYGIPTEGIPLVPFVKEDLMYLDKEELRDVIKFFNGLIAQETGLYSTNLATRDATITSALMEVNGGSRLNYRTNPDWVPNTKEVTYNNYTSVEFDN